MWSRRESAPWTVSSWGKKYTYTNLSDHYPVIGSATEATGER